MSDSTSHIAGGFSMMLNGFRIMIGAADMFAVEARLKRLEGAINELNKGFHGMSNAMSVDVDDLSAAIHALDEGDAKKFKEIAARIKARSVGAEDDK